VSYLLFYCDINTSVWEMGDLTPTPGPLYWLQIAAVPLWD